MSHRSIPQAFLDRVASAPAAPALIVWNNDDTRQTFTAEELLTKVRTTADRLRDQGLRRNEIIILALDHSSELVCTFLASLFVGAKPVICSYPTSQVDDDAYLTQVAELIEYSDADAVIVEPGLERRLQNLVQHYCRVHSMLGIVSGDRIVLDDETEFGQGEEIAYLQYTSGSTGRQKGVMLSHRAVMANVESMTLAYEITDQDVCVNWLPLYHDFGLVFGLLTPLLNGVVTVLISPHKWVRRPSLLLKAVDEYRATISALPNFALIHLSRTVRASAVPDYDLSTLRLLLWGSEPCRMSSHQTFMEHFSRTGISPETLTAGYGMAELTLAVTSASLHTLTETQSLEGISSRRSAIVDLSDDHVTSYVSCGAPTPGNEVRIVATDGAVLGERSIGEITVRSPSLFSGYHLRPDLTASVLQDGWYFTGDLGFMADGQLFVCDRKKDLVIVGGHNVYPADVEAIAQQHPDVRSTGVVAFGIPNEQTGTESLAVACELTGRIVPQRRLEIEAELRKAILAAIGIAPSRVFLVSRGQLQKTRNGKLARSLNRDYFSSQANQKTRRLAAG